MIERGLSTGPWANAAAADSKSEATSASRKAANGWFRRRNMAPSLRPHASTDLPRGLVAIA
jgi:hypothetical protein